MKKNPRPIGFGPCLALLFSCCLFAQTRSLSQVRNFIYQLDKINLEAIGSTGFDLAIIDFSYDDDGETREFSSDQINALKNSSGRGKIVLSYLSIGEAEDYRFYWQPYWEPGNPAWLDAQNPDWPGNYKVHFWDPAWQAVIFQYLDKIIDSGFDGIYCDIIDAYEYFQDEGRTTAAQEMVDFVASLRLHARARDPNFLVFVQNAAELAVAEPSYLDAVDGIGQEDAYYGYDGDGIKTPDEVTAEIEDDLKLFRDTGKLVLTVDYPFFPGADVPVYDPLTLMKIDDAYARSQSNGFIPYCTVRNLDFPTVNPGHEPSAVYSGAADDWPSKRQGRESSTIYLETGRRRADRP